MSDKGEPSPGGSFAHYFCSEKVAGFGDFRAS